MHWMMAVLVGLLAACAPEAEGEADLPAAMAAVREGNLEPAGRLTVSPEDVPELSGYLKDSNEAVRREAVVLLTGIGGLPACDALVPAVTDSSADIRERTVRALHDLCAVEISESLPQLGAALRESVRMGNTSAAALLLLGRYREDENREFLRSLLRAETPVVKLESWHHPVPQSLAVAVAAVSAGYSPARDRLFDGLGKIEEAEFLALVLGDIDDTVTLEYLLKLLDDERTTSSGVPSGAQPRRRLCDLATDEFARRFGLQPFPLRTSDRYSDEEIDQVRTLAAEAIAQR